MRIFLCYPPLSPTDSAEALRALDDQDNSVIALGMYILAAMMKEAGHEVVLENFALVPWSQALAKIEAARPEIFGVSCYTFHRHTVAKFTQEVRARLPACHIIVGGVHVSALPLATLERWPWVDTVAVGEAEISFPALVARLVARESLKGLLGIAHRDEAGVPVLDGCPPPVEDLDALPIAGRYWPHTILATARGCPFNCNFCSSPSVWGRRVRMRSVGHVIQELEAVRRAGLTQVAFKDETFTFRASRVAELCEAMIDSRLGLWWTCDTRADCVDEERLLWMRRAGCFEISLGVETGSAELMRYYNKRETPDKVVAATRLARKLGFHVRHYYIIGAPGETASTLRQTLALIDSSRPTRVFLCALEVLPGTDLYREMVRDRGFTDATWFDRTEPGLLADPALSWRRLPEAQRLEGYVNVGPRRPTKSMLWPLTLEELRAAALEVPDAWAAHYDLSQKQIEAEDVSGAIASLRRTLELRADFGKALIDLAGLLRRQGEREAALEALARVDTLAHEPESHKLLALIRRTEVLRDLNRPDEAIMLAVEVIRRNPRVLEAYEIAVDLLLATRRAPSALKIAESWARQMTTDPRPHRIIGAVMFVSGRLAEARVAFQAALERGPDHAETLRNLAVVNARLGAPGAAS